MKYCQKQHVEANDIAMRAIALHVKDLSSYIYIGRLVKLCSKRLTRRLAVQCFSQNNLPNHDEYNAVVVSRIGQ
jgi:hypothetical protein